MRILAIDHDIIERGGINRIVEGLKYGLEAAGCTFDYYWASRGGKLRGLSPTTPTMMGDRYYRLPAKQLSYGRKDSARNYAKLLRDYDAVMMVLPCPHDIKGKSGDMSWMLLYEVAAGMGKPIVTIIHDNLWDKYYPWYRQVSDYVKFHVFTCYQAKYDSLSRLPGNHVFLPTTLDVREAGLYADEKQPSLAWLPQWKVWKGIYPFLEALPAIEYPVDLYNAGIEYHKVRQDPSGVWKRVIGLNHVNKTKGKGNSLHQYWGAQMPDIIPTIYKTHQASIDLSGSIGDRFDGQTSCVMLEAMLYGCVSVVHEKVNTHPWSPLAGQGVSWTVPSDPTGIAASINELFKKPKLQEKLAARALEFVTEYSDARKSAYTILEFLGNEHLTITPSAPATFFDSVCEDPVPVYDVATYAKGEYLSKHAPKTIEEVEEEAAVAAAEEILEEATGMDIRVPDREMLGQLSTLMRTAPSDGNWMAFITDVANAWLKHFG